MGGGQGDMMSTSPWCIYPVSSGTEATKLMQSADTHDHLYRSSVYL